MNKKPVLPIIQALLAALLFGASAPLAKMLLGEVQPVPMAAILYLGSGAGLLIFRLVERIGSKGRSREPGIEKADFGWLAGAVLAGGVAAPILLMISLKTTAAATAALLLNFESVATTLIAFFAFKESVSRRAWLAVGSVTAASILLSINFDAAWGISLGALGVLGACVLWGIDNNFTRNISTKDPLVIVTVKGLVSGSFSLILALILGNSFPSGGAILRALVLGSLSYGASIVLFIHAMRGMGAARTSALFSTAPAAGVVLSLLLFREAPGWLFAAALALMALGAILLLNEDHAHTHVHEPVTHDHSHSHGDGHHNHEHEGEQKGRHSHPHTHEQLSHSHQHLPDLHHRHDHS